MEFSPTKVNWFLLFKLPSAYFSGVRVKEISEERVVVKVKFRWINQNPFKSMYWATQGMASELATGILVMKAIADSGKRISMLVTAQQGSFSKKARGLISFNCYDKELVLAAISKLIETNEPQTMTLSSVGIDELGDEVSRFTYEWSIKLK